MMDAQLRRRILKASGYPEDSDDENDREGLDEEEQQRLIQQLQKQNDTRNAQYSMVFTAIPLFFACMLCIPSLLSASTMSERFFSLLAFFSLVTSAYIMRASPLHPDRKGKKPMSAADERLACIRSVLVLANGVVCFVLVLAYLLGSPTPYATRWLLYLTPGAMLFMILVVRIVMLDVDIASLKDLQYEYKGA